ncbi:DUF6611 family protein [Leifsonia aquatica]|uniref:DUF6611 family protein n=1 Tax=Leifsonia aquatica TaxID=144185 RepID=UPI003D2FAA30
MVVVAYLAGLWLGPNLTRDLPSRARAIRADEILVAGEMTECGDVQGLRVVITRLDQLESQRRGCIDPVRYEAEWAAIYNSAASREHVRV